MRCLVFIVSPNCNKITGCGKDGEQDQRFGTTS